jgi:hypothetical protein
MERVTAKEERTREAYARLGWTGGLGTSGHIAQRDVKAANRLPILFPCECCGTPTPNVETALRASELAYRLQEGPKLSLTDLRKGKRSLPVKSWVTGWTLRVSESTGLETVDATWGTEAEAVTVPSNVLSILRRTLTMYKASASVETRTCVCSGCKAKASAKARAEAELNTAWEALNSVVDGLDLLADL